MLKLHLVLLLLNLILPIVLINADCTVNLQNEKPLIVKNFGSRKLMYTQSEPALQLVVGESMYAYCATNLLLSTNYGRNYISEGSAIKSVEIECSTNDIIHFRDLIGDSRVESHVRSSEIVYISCSQRSQHYLYESSKTLKNCHHMSYAIGTSVPNLKDIVTAGICYDLDTLNLKFIHYLAYRPKYEFVVNLPSKPTNVASVTLGKKLGNLNQYFKFMSDSTFETLLQEKRSKLPLLQSFEFDFVSIMQAPSIKYDYAYYSNMLNTIWWRNLRIGNWKLFLETLEERAKSINYNIYLGAAGNLSIPTTGCNRSATFTLEDDDVSVQAPQYIWAYLQSLQSNLSEEFVVIGYNSPIYLPANSEIFCADMCNEIAWLQNTLFNRMRLMPTMGVVFCCHPAEMAAKFNDFPYTVKLAIAETTALPDYKNANSTITPGF